MNKSLVLLLSTCFLISACGKQEAAAPAPAVADAPVEMVEAPEAQPAVDQAAALAAAEDSSEAVAPADTGAAVQPSLRLGANAGPPSMRFREGQHYQKLVPAQPTAVAPGKVEVIEVFWYGCGHCFTLDPAIESWKARGKAEYVDFQRVPAMWNEGTRVHARLFYALEALGKLEELHTLVFREIHVNNNPLNNIPRIASFLQPHGISRDDLEKAFSSFAVESKLQRADLLNRRYRVQSVPMMVINGKYTSDVGSAGSEPRLFNLLDDLSAFEHGG